MKKIILLLIVILLCGCSNNEKLDLDRVKTNLETLAYNDSLMFDNNEYITLEKLHNKYSVDTTYIDSYAISMDKDSKDSNMFIIVSGKDKSKLKEEMNKLFQLIEASFGNGYTPKEEAKIKNRMEREYGGYLIYIVSDDNSLVYNKVKE